MGLSMSASGEDAVNFSQALLQRRLLARDLEEEVVA